MIIAPTKKLLREQMVTAMRGFPIKKLMPEQWWYIDLYRDEYFRVASITDPADRPRAEAAITQLYAAIGKEAPTFEWGPSPQWELERSASLSGSLRYPLGASFGTLFGDSIRSSIEKAITGNLRDVIADLMGCIQQSYWIAHHIYAAEVLGVPYQAEHLQKLYLHDEVVRSCNDWWPYEGTCICIERPEIVEWCTFDDPPTLQRVVYRDGFEGRP